MPLIVLLILVSLAPGASLTTTAEAQGVRGAAVRGVVYDSLARAPLAGATVQLVRPADPEAFSRTARSDAAGRFEMSGIPDGRYVIGFLHPLLDSLGISAPMAEVFVAGGAADDVALAVPSPARLRVAICGAGSSGAAVVGTIRDSRDHVPLPGAVVTAQWLEYAIRTGSAVPAVKRTDVQAREDGWFSFCDVPTAGTVVLSARLGADSTDAIEVDIDASRFQRRDLYLGESEGATVVDSLPDATTRVVKVGKGRLTGTVVAAEGGRPLGGARVGIVGGPETTTNPEGEWTLEGVPSGTRTLEARGIGFYPARRAVDVVAGAAPVRLSLATLRSLLDTVRVNASRLRLEGTGFDERRRSGMGRYITAEQMARFPAFMTSQLFARVPGVRLDRGALGATYLTVRGPFGRCSPSVYLDGHHIPGLSAEDIDGWAHPDDIAGIEIYTGAFVPSEFQPGMSGCGSIVIWTKPYENRRAGWSPAERAARGAAALLLGALVGALIQR